MKGKSYDFLNIAGLAIGIACASLIFLWVEDEVSFDHVFKKRERLYQIMENQNYNGALSTVSVTPGKLCEAIKTEIPGVENAARASGDANVLFSYGDKNFYEKGMNVDASFFSMFSLSFIKGDSRHAFDQLYSLVITEKMAEKFFSEANPIGQTIKVNDDKLYTVTGVVKNLPQNTSITFQWLAPFELVVEKAEWLNRWDANGILTYVELQEGVNETVVNKKLENFLHTKLSTIDTKCFLFGMHRWHLYNHFSNGKQDGGQVKYVELFITIALLILFIACVNFMNLATARAEQRAKEVGVRKALGAGRKILIRQFIAESLIRSYTAVALATGLIYFLLPPFNAMVEKNLSLDLIDPIHFLSLIAMGAFTGFCAGSYPAFYLSSFSPVIVLKGLKIKTSASAIFIRKGLVTSQFVVSITLIICTVIIYRQIQHTQNRDLGYLKENILYIEAHEQVKEHFSAVRTALLKTGEVENATMNMNPAFHAGWFSGDGYAWQGKDPNNNVLITFEGVTPEYVSTMGLKLKEGRDFYSNAQQDLDNVIINESMARIMGEGSQIGNSISQQTSAQDASAWKMKVIGVVEDFVFGNMYGTSPGPIILTCNPADYHYLTLRIAQRADLPLALKNIESIVKSYDPGYPFEYHFVDEEFDKLFKGEILIGKLSGIFAILAIVISCLGLFGLAAHTAMRRTKELSIRKVLGASVHGLTGMLSREFLSLIVVACLFSFPAAWWIMNEWLQNFEYRIPVEAWVFLATGVAALGITFVTVSFQTLKAARVNPATTLRKE